MHVLKTPMFSLTGMDACFILTAVSSPGLISYCLLLCTGLYIYTKCRFSGGLCLLCTHMLDLTWSKAVEKSSSQTFSQVDRRPCLEKLYWSQWVRSLAGINHHLSIDLQCILVICYSRGSGSSYAVTILVLARSQLSFVFLHKTEEAVALTTVYFPSSLKAKIVQLNISWGLLLGRDLWKLL